MTRVNTVNRGIRQANRTRGALRRATATGGNSRGGGARIRASLATAILVIASSNAPRAAWAADSQVCEREMVRAAQANDIPLNVLYAVGLTETGRKGTLNPFDMNVDGRTVSSASLNEALEKFAAEKARGAQMIDIGCMQINHHWHASDFHSLSEMFDPARNVRYAANFLKELRAREGTWTLAVARYNAGPNNDPAQ